MIHSPPSVHSKVRTSILQREKIILEIAHEKKLTSILSNPYFTYGCMYNKSRFYTINSTIGYSRFKKMHIRVTVNLKKVTDCSVKRTKTKMHQLGEINVRNF